MLAMAALKATLSALESEDAYAASRRIFDQISTGLSDEPVVVRGAGCLIGLSFETPVSSLCQALRERNILVGTSADPNVMRLMPPVVATSEDVDNFLTELRHAQQDGSIAEVYSVPEIPFSNEAGL